jgi:hypothetical protein
MADIENYGLGEDAIKSVDDVPSVSRLANRQLFLNKWYKLVAMAPFLVVLVVSLWFFPNSSSRFLAALAIATVLWAAGVACYAFYLIFAVRCPRCHERFGLGENCKSCALPRHPDASAKIDLSTFRPLD